MLGYKLEKILDDAVDYSISMLYLGVVAFAFGFIIGYLI